MFHDEDATRTQQLRATLTSLRHCSRACGGILPRWFL